VHNVAQLRDRFFKRGYHLVHITIFFLFLFMDLLRGIRGISETKQLTNPC